jgi:choline monooxygenase
MNMAMAPETLNAALYRGPEAYARERASVFARAWHLYSHESLLPKPGSYVAETIAGYPIIAVRGDDGVIRAFHNVCRHRAGPLAEDGEGICERALTCKYHGWRYALDGRLMAARDFGPAAGFNARDYGLVPLACGIWRGFVFINIEREATPLATALAPFTERAAKFPFENFRFAMRRTHDIACNWKTYVENYLEGYHIPVIHPTLASQIESTVYEVETVPPLVFYRAPPLADATVAGLWAWLWPTLGANIYSDGVMMERMWPLGPNHTRLDYLYFFAPDVAREHIKRTVETSEITTGEDIRICEAVQRNLDAGIYTSGRLSPKHEMGVAWFQAEVKAALGNLAISA